MGWYELMDEDVQERLYMDIDIDMGSGVVCVQNEKVIK